MIRIKSTNARYGKKEDKNSPKLCQLQKKMQKKKTKQNKKKKQTKKKQNLAETLIGDRVTVPRS